MNKLKELCLFYATVYVKAWFCSPVTCDAPQNDLNLFQQLIKYENINETVSVAAMSKWKGHLWYVAPELIPLSLFSNNVKTEDKRRIQKHILQFGNGDWSQRTIRLNSSVKLRGKKLWQLVDKTSICALRALKINTDFILKTDPELWEDSAVYLEDQNRVRSLKVINDLAERSIGFVSRYNDSPLTRNENEFQKVLQTVEDNCKRVKNVTKNTMKTYETL
jgi:hypothetical protein